MIVAFDLDGTLMHPAKGAAPNFLAAAEATLCIEGMPSSWGSYRDVTDLGILEEVAQKHLGRSVSEAEVSQVRRLHHAGLQALAAADTGRFVAIAGAAALIAQLQESHDVGIATGNFRITAAVKLHACGLGYLDLTIKGAEDGPARSSVVAALHRHFGTDQRLVAVGDGRWDVEAARDLAVPFIGVHTRAEGRERLRAAGARDVLSDLMDCDGFEVLLREAIPPL